MRNCAAPYVLLPLFVVFMIFTAETKAQAGAELSMLKDIQLFEAPRDVAVASDGAVAYVLCNKSIQILSLSERRLTGAMPLTGDYEKIAISPAGDELILTDSKKMQVTIVQVSQAYDIPVGATPIIGKKDAPVTIVAFLDYQCPYCSKAYPLLEQSLAKYPNEVRLVIKQYPLKFHPAAEFAAIAALAAARQNKYKELSSLMMQNSSQLSEQLVRQSAFQVGLTAEQLDAAANDPAIKKQIADDSAAAARCNLRGVPSVYINGRFVKSNTLDGFSAIIDQELKKKKS